MALQEIGPIMFGGTPENHHLFQDKEGSGQNGSVYKFHMSSLQIYMEGYFCTICNLFLAAINPWLSVLEGTSKMQ